MSDDAARAPKSKGANKFKRPPRGPARHAQHRRASEASTLYLFGLHAVRDALANPKRKKRKLMATPNALQKLAAEARACHVPVEEHDPRKFAPPIDPQSVHQGAVLETDPLEWGEIEDVCAPTDAEPAPRVLLLDRVTDPHNVGAILRSSEVFGAKAVIAPRRHAAPETGALAKSASGALERQPYLRVQNLSRAIRELQELGYLIVGLAGEADETLDQALKDAQERPVALVLGAEGPGLREGTREACDKLAKIEFAADFGSLNVSNAAAVALYAATRR